MSDDKAIRAARLTLGGMLEKRRAETAKDRAPGQIAPSKYLPGVPRQVHAYGGSVPHMPVARIVPSRGGSDISDWTQALIALKGVMPKTQEQAQQVVQPAPATGPVGAPAPTPEANGISPQAAAAMEALRASWDQPLTITSGYRDPDTNQAVGGAKGSQHLHGNAYDIDASEYTPEQRLALANAALAAGFTGFGFYDNSLHFDVGPSRAWGPSYHSDSIPDWAQDWVGDNIYASGGRVGKANGGTVEGAETVARMLREGRASEITNEHLDAADPQHLWKLYETGQTGMDMPMDAKSRAARAKELGFTSKEFHGTTTGGEMRYPSPNYGSGSREGIGFVTSSNPHVASSYADPKFGSVLPMLNRDQNLANIDAKGEVWSGIPDETEVALPGGAKTTVGRYASGPADMGGVHDTNQIARGARIEGDGGVRISNLIDRGIHVPDDRNDPSLRTEFQKKSSVPSDVTFRHDTRGIRSFFARFDPRLAHLSHLNASTGGKMEDPVDLNVERARKNIASGELPEHIQNTFDSMAERNRAQLSAHQEAMQAGAFDDTRIGDEYRAPNGSTFKITNHFMMPANRWGGREPPSMVYQGHVPMVSTVYTDPKMKGFDMNRAVEHVKQMERIGGPLRVVKADGGSVADRSPMFEGMSEHMRDEEGKPLELWHGTPGQPFEAFDDRKVGVRDPGFYGRGHYLTPDRGVAEAYADPDEMGRGSVMGPMHAALKNPYVWDVSDEQKSHRTLRDLQSMGIMTGQGKIEPWDNLQRHHIGPFMAEMKRRGHDGVIYKTGHGVKEIVVFNPNSIKHRDAEVGDPEDPRIMRADGGRLYSKAAKIVRGLKDQKMDAADILKYAAGKGAKKAELDYVNVPPGKTTPSQVAEHIERNQPRIDVVRRGDAINEYKRMMEGDMMSYKPEDFRRLDELEREAMNIGNRPQYAQYQLPGGTNYREHILTLPDHPDTYTANSHWGDLPNPLAHIRMSDRTVMPPHEEMNEYLDRVMKHGKGVDGAVEDGVLSPQEGATVARYFGADYSPLYTKPGIEKKILHVEEMQSDWNSDARRRGFRTGTEQQDYDNFVKDMRQRAVEQSEASPMVKAALEKKYAEMDPHSLALKMGQQEEHNRLYRLAKYRRPPQAPYVNPDRDDWAELAMKHVLGEAAKGGYSGVTFTPDAQQSARWGGTEFKDMYDKKFPAIAQRLAQQHDPSIKASTTSVTPFLQGPMIPLTDDARESIMKNGFASFRRGGIIGAGLELTRRFTKKP